MVGSKFTAKLSFDSGTGSVEQQGGAKRPSAADLEDIPQEEVEKPEGM